MDFSSLILTVVIGTLFVSLYYLKSYLGNAVEGIKDAAEQSNKGTQPTHVPTEAKQKKKLVPERRSKDSKPAFSHAWHVTTLKGHTSHILDLDFSPNGKYLASCAEVVDRELETASSDCNSDVSVNDQLPSEKEVLDETQDIDIDNFDSFDRTLTRLSRRQRKNRQEREKQREKQRETVSKKTVKKEKKKRANVRKVRCGSYVFTEEQIYPFLRSYALSDHALLTLGFPLEIEDGKAVIYKADLKRLENKNFDVNANEFVPGKRSYSSKFDETPPSHTPSSEGSNDDYEICASDFGDLADVRNCIRCLKPFVYAEGATEECVYHLGKYKGYDLTWGGYKCCGAKFKAEGCARSAVHVWSGLQLGFNGPLDGFVRSKNRKKGDPLSVYAIDCEMVYTTKGRELARVTLIDILGNVVYDENVKPESQIVDYVTKYSGITEKHVVSATKTINDVQSDLLNFIFADTVLIGHALNNDLQVLRLIHPICVDTSVVFTHHKGLPRRYSLKDLARSVLGRYIQGNDSGHCSIEDAVTCLDLMTYRILQDYLLDNNGSSGSH